MSSDDMERRSIPLHETRLEVREAGGGESPGTLDGYAAVFNSLSLPLRAKDGRTFRERIRPGAFDRVLSDPDRDVVGLRNHDPDKLLGREGNDTLELRTDGRGLRYTVDLAPTSYARDTAALVERQDIKGSSFSFEVAQGGDDWKRDGGTWIREIREIAQVGDVGPVTNEAYPATSVSERALQAAARLPEATAKYPGRVIEPEWAQRNVKRLPVTEQERLRALAYHEAAHQVVAWWAGGEPAGAELRFEQKAGRWTPVGGTSHRDHDTWTDRDLALEAVAGVVAEERVTGERASLSCSAVDQRRVRDYYRLTGTPESELREKAREILEEHRVGLRDIAEAIYRDGRISGEDARDILERVGDADPQKVQEARNRRRRRRQRAAGGWW